MVEPDYFLILSLAQNLNAWFQGIDAYDRNHRVGVYNNLDVCG